jgi:Protein of unknown function (DUF3383)
MTTPTLSIDTLINVSVNLSPAGAQAQNTSVGLMLGNSAVIDPVTRIRYYTTLSAVATDFGTTAPEYLSAQAWFAQTPQPTEFAIGRWVQTASAGQLLCAPLAPAQQLLSYWTGLASAAFKIAIDGGSVTNIPMTGTPFSGATSLQGVAAVIQAAARSALSDLVVVVYNPQFERFEFTSPTTGASSTVSFLTAGVVDIDISGSLGGLSTSSGAYVSPGLAAETAVSAAVLFDSNFGQTWFALFMPTISVDADAVAVAAFIQGTSTKHRFGITSSEGAIINNPADTSNIAYLIKAGDYGRTYVQYSSTSPYAVISAFARIMTTNYNGNNTTITLMWKQEPIITAENLNETQLTTLQSFRANVFAAYNNNTAILESFVGGDGIYADVGFGTDNFAIDLQTALYNALYLSTTKIPQTDAGMHQLATVMKGICIQYVSNGFIAPGVWTVGGFGTLNMGDFMPTGYYIFQPTVASQNQTQRLARVSVPFQIAIKLAGAVQTVNVAVVVNS